jgi:hypothetical protein
LLVVVHPTGNANQEEGKGIHAEIIPSARSGDEHFIGEQHGCAARKDQNSNELDIVRVFGQCAMNLEGSSLSNC